MAKGIFCLETEWDFSTHKLKDETAVQPMLDFLKNHNKMEYVYRRVATRSDLMFYLKQLKKASFNKYEIVYLSFHGDTQAIKLEGENKEKALVTLSELSQIANGAFKDKFVHFGSCRTFLGSGSALENFKIETGSKIVSGYTRSVDYTLSSLMDIAYFNELNNISVKYNTVENPLEKRFGGLKLELGFRLI